MRGGTRKPPAAHRRADKRRELRPDRCRDEPEECLILLSRTRFACSGELQIAYEVRGGLPVSRRPALLLIQGLGFDRAGWGPAIGPLRRRFRLALVDNRGSGRTAASGSFSVADMAGDALAVLDNAGIGVAHVLGASLGGMIAQELAIRHPERVSRLILACTTPGWPFAYPMPLPSVRLIAASQRLPPDEAVRRHVENALSATTVANRPELVQRIIDCQRSSSERVPCSPPRRSRRGRPWPGRSARRAR